MDAVLVRRDGTVLGAARIPAGDFGESGGEAHMSQVIDAVVAACADAVVSLERFPVADLGVDIKPKAKIVKMEPPPKRQAGKKVESVDQLVELLHSEAKVI